MRINGYVAPGLEPLADAFTRNFALHDEVGAALCIYRHGKPQIDIWAGVADLKTGRPWEHNTVALAFSATKGVTAICLHHMAQKGILSLDTPIAVLWPAFAAAGKEAITPRMVMAHRAGVPLVDATLTLEEVLSWDPVVEAIAAQAPSWPPDTDHGYHIRSYGWILGEVIRRVTGATAGQYLAREIAAPLDLNCWIGVPEDELTRCARMIPALHPAVPAVKMPAADSLLMRALTGPSGLFRYDEMWNKPLLLKAELPSSNGVCDARSLARLYAATIGSVDGIRLLEPATIADATRPVSHGIDRVLGVQTRFSSGFMLPPCLVSAAPEGSFGHVGAGGALGFADPVNGIGFAYVMNRMRFQEGGDPRATSLVEALYELLLRPPA